MSLPYRHNFKWNVNELLSLQREYEAFRNDYSRYCV